MIAAGSVPAARLAGIAALRASGVDSADYDATELLAFALGRPRGLLPLADDLTADDAARYAELIARRARREPLQHILGAAGFYGQQIAVGPGVFIPRPETELLVEHALSAVANVAAPRVVDLCSGSGAIAIAIAAQRPDARVSAVERSAEALPWLRRNVADLAPQVNVVAGDVLDVPLRDIAPPGRVDLLTCNPPYVPTTTPVDPEVDADPYAAVFAGSDGLELIRPLAARIADLLRDGAVALLEHDASHQPLVVDVLADTGRFSSVEPLRDLAGRPRFVRAVRADG